MRRVGISSNYKTSRKTALHNFIDQESEVLAVLTARGKKLQFFNLSKGKLVHEIDLQVPCLRVRAYNGWIYLQTRKGIIRTIIPFNL